MLTKEDLIGFEGKELELRFLVFFFILLPILELYLLFAVHGQLADRFGTGRALLVTFGMIVLTGVIGARMTRREGAATLNRLKQKLSQGQEPTAELLEGLLIFLAGMLLITPGYLSDALGFFLVIPTSRRIFLAKCAQFIRHSSQYVFRNQVVFTNYRRPSPQSPRSSAMPQDVIDVDVVEESPKDK